MGINYQKECNFGMLETSTETQPSQEKVPPYTVFNVYKHTF
jgi:hypothetical protein